jgi:1-deoxy-D-xylulose-5-phosphate reductoisomerase
LHPSKIDVIVHPQSVIHSIVQFEDGSMKAQMGLPDMKLPIQFALGFPTRIKNNYPRFNFLDYPTLDFELPNTKIFRNLALAFEAMKMGGNMPCILNAANEVVVEAFLNGKITFLQMPAIIEKAMQKVAFIEKPALNDLIQTNAEARTATMFLTENQK